MYLSGDGKLIFLNPEPKTLDAIRPRGWCCILQDASTVFRSMAPNLQTPNPKP
jgi:hypothetical protein